MSLGAILYIAAVGIVLGLVIWRLALAHSRLTGEGAEGRRFSEWGGYRVIPARRVRTTGTLAGITEC
jgi:hypothetical protein